MHTAQYKLCRDMLKGRTASVIHCNLPVSVLLQMVLVALAGLVESLSGSKNTSSNRVQNYEFIFSINMIQGIQRYI